MLTGRIVIIPFLHGKLSADGSLVEPDIDAILEKWLDRHPEFRGRDFHVIRAKMTLEDDDLLLVERAREWLLEQQLGSDEARP